MAPIFTGGRMGFGRVDAPSGSAASPFSATGGTKSTPGDGYIYHVYTSPGSQSFDAQATSTTNIEFVIVGGGGGGGHGGDASSGGGGAGGLVYGILPSGLSAGSYPVVIGGGGASGAGGGNGGVPGGGSTLAFNTGTITAQGGGAGQSRPGSGPLSQPGGNGGGGSMFASPTSGAPGTQPSENPGNPLVNTQYGNPGGNGSSNTQGGAGGSANGSNSQSVNATFPNSSTILSGSPIGGNSLARGGYGTNDSYGDGPAWPGTSYGSGGSGGRNQGTAGINGFCVIRYPSSA
jgi:hypothetical protein